MGSFFAFSSGISMNCSVSVRIPECLHLFEERVAGDAGMVGGVVLAQFVQFDPLVPESTRCRGGGWQHGTSVPHPESDGPGSKSTRNILPGCKRPLSLTLAGSTGSTPTSLAMMTRSSCVT